MFPRILEHHVDELERMLAGAIDNKMFLGPQKNTKTNTRTH